MTEAERIQPRVVLAVAGPNSVLPLLLGIVLHAAFDFGAIGA